MFRLDFPPVLLYLLRLVPGGTIKENLEVNEIALGWGPNTICLPWVPKSLAVHGIVAASAVIHPGSSGSVQRMGNFR